MRRPARCPLDTWFEGDQKIPVGTRIRDAVHTPGHTAGHYVFADRSAQLLFAGDHVLPTITPSIGFTMPRAPNSLGDFMASLTKVRALPDMRVLPAHRPVAPSTMNVSTSCSAITNIGWPTSSLSWRIDR